MFLQKWLFSLTTSVTSNHNIIEWVLKIDQNFQSLSMTNKFLFMIISFANNTKILGCLLLVVWPNSPKSKSYLLSSCFPERTWFLSFCPSPKNLKLFLEKWCVLLWIIFGKSFWVFLKIFSIYCNHFSIDCNGNLCILSPKFFKKLFLKFCGRSSLSIATTFQMTTLENDAFFLEFFLVNCFEVFSISSLLIATTFQISQRSKFRLSLTISLKTANNNLFCCQKNLY